MSDRQRIANVSEIELDEFGFEIPDEYTELEDEPVDFWLDDDELAGLDDVMVPSSLAGLRPGYVWCAPAPYVPVEIVRATFNCAFCHAVFTPKPHSNATTCGTRCRRGVAIRSMKSIGSWRPRGPARH